MLISASQLKNILVVTESGVEIGKVADFEMEVETQTVINFVVRRGLLGKNLLINRYQIKSITAEKIVVDDNTAKELAEAGGEKQYESPAVNY